MLRTNKKDIVKQSVCGKICHPTRSKMSYALDVDGKLHIFPATGGITYNKNLGDCAFGLQGDHVEPAVSTNNTAESGSYMTLSCVGNEAIMVSGEAKGAKGFVIGKHGGIDHVMVQFKLQDQEKMVPEDKILVKALGQGTKLIDYPDITVMNIDTDLLEKLEIEEKDGKLIVPVKSVIPSGLMGSGLGQTNAYDSDTDIITQDRELIESLGINKLCFGDFVLVEDYYTEFGTTNVRGAKTFGVIVHSDCVKNGHGPGVTALLTCRKPLLEAKIGGRCNLKDYLAFED